MKGLSFLSISLRAQEIRFCQLGSWLCHFKDTILLKCKIHRLASVGGRSYLQEILPFKKEKDFPIKHESKSSKECARESQAKEEKKDMRGIESPQGQDTTQTPAIWSSLALLSADRLLSFEGEARLKASHGIRDRTSKGKARLKSLLGKRPHTGSGIPRSHGWRLTFSIGIEGYEGTIPLLTLPSRESLPWVRIRSWKRMPVYQFIFIKGQGQREAQSKRKRLLLLIDWVGRDQRSKGFVPGKSGFTYLLYDIDWSCQKRRTWKSFLLTRLDCAKAVPLIQLWLASRIR